MQDGVPDGKESGEAKERPVFMCMACGHISNVIPAKCPVCGAGKENFKKLEK